MDVSCAADESAFLRTAKSCGPDASMVGVKLVKEISPATVTTKPDHRGEYEISRKTIACGNAGCPGATVVTNACVLLPYTRGCGCNGHPAFPTPFVGRIVFAQLGRIVPRECGCSSNRHRPARPDDPVFQGAGDGIEKLRRTGYSAGACHRARRRRDPMAEYDGLL
jgi:hypothetical protein